MHKLAYLPLMWEKKILWVQWNIKKTLTLVAAHGRETSQSIHKLNHGSPSPFGHVPLQWHQMAGIWECWRSRLKHDLEKQTVRWVNCRLDHHALWVLTGSMKSRWQTFTTGVLQGSKLDLILVNVFTPRLGGGTVSPQQGHWWHPAGCPGTLAGYPGREQL